jgi:hypothetical protein
VLALGGGLALAYLKAAREASPLGAPAASQPGAKPGARQNPSPAQTNNAAPTTTGAGSPVVHDIQGDVTITVDQSSGTNGSGTDASKKVTVPAKKASP